MQTDDMTAPLTQYYLHTSHNSYLTGNQLWSRSSTAPIITALNLGCRVIELDCWEKNGKVKVLHGGYDFVNFDENKVLRKIFHSKILVTDHNWKFIIISV